MKFIDDLKATWHDGDRVVRVILIAVFPFYVAAWWLAYFFGGDD
jgi:hypothetical protein